MLPSAIERAAVTAWESGLRVETTCSHLGARLIGSKTPESSSSGNAAVKITGAKEFSSRRIRANQ